MKFKEMVKDFTGQSIKGSLHFSNYRLTSLEGRPDTIINGTFDCSDNNLKSLEYCPKMIGKGINSIKKS